MGKYKWKKEHEKFWKYILNWKKNYKIWWYLNQKTKILPI